MIEEKIANPYKCQPPQNHVGEGGGREGYLLTHPPRNIVCVETTQDSEFHGIHQFSRSQSDKIPFEPQNTHMHAQKQRACPKIVPIDSV